MTAAPKNRFLQSQKAWENKINPDKTRIEEFYARMDHGRWRTPATFSGRRWSEATSGHRY
jgi:hypothetical protein